MKIVGGRRGEKKATHSRGLNVSFPDYRDPFVSLLPANPENVSAISRRRALSTGSEHSTAYRRESMVENGGTHFSPDAAVNQRLDIWFPTNFSHKVVEERSSSPGRCCLRWTEEVALLESQKYRQYAAECIRLAQTMTSVDKQTLLEIASAWEKRAQEAERREKRKA